MKKYRITEKHNRLKEGTIYTQTSNSESIYFWQEVEPGITNGYAIRQDEIDAHPTWYEEVKPAVRKKPVEFISELLGLIETRMLRFGRWYTADEVVENMHKLPSEVERYVEGLNYARNKILDYQREITE